MENLAVPSCRLAEGPGRDTSGTMERSDEVREVTEPDVERDVGDRACVVGQPSRRMARITPEELHAMIAAGHDPVVVDARGGTALEVTPVVIPGALRIRWEEIETRHTEIPRGSDVVVYCS